MKKTAKLMIAFVAPLILVIALMAAQNSVRADVEAQDPAPPVKLPEPKLRSTEDTEAIWAYYRANHPEYFPSGAPTEEMRNSIAASDPSAASLYFDDFKETGESGDCGAWGLNPTSNPQVLPWFAPEGCGTVTWDQGDLGGDPGYWRTAAYTRTKTQKDFMVDYTGWIYGPTTPITATPDDGWWQRIFVMVDGVDYWEDEAAECIFGEDAEIEGAWIGCISPNWSHVDGLPYTSSHILIDGGCPAPFGPAYGDCEIGYSIWEFLSVNVKNTPYWAVINDGGFTSDATGAYPYRGYWRRGTNTLMDTGICHDSGSCPDACDYTETDPGWHGTSATECSTTGNGTGFEDFHWDNENGISSATQDVTWNAYGGKNITCKWDGNFSVNGTDPGNLEVGCSYLTDEPTWRTCYFEKDETDECDRWLVSGVEDITKFRMIARNLVVDSTTLVYRYGGIKVYQNTVQLGSMSPGSINLEEGGRIWKYANEVPEYGDDWDLRPNGLISVTIDRQAVGGTGDIEVGLRISGTTQFVVCELNDNDEDCTIDLDYSTWTEFDAVRIENTEASNNIVLEGATIKLESWCPVPNDGSMSKSDCDKEPNVPPWIIPQE